MAGADLPTSAFSGRLQEKAGQFVEQPVPGVFQMQEMGPHLQRDHRLPGGPERREQRLGIGGARKSVLCATDEQGFVGHPLLSQLHTVEGYLRAVHCSVTPRGPALGRIEAALGALSPHRKVALQVPDFLSVPTLVGQSDLVAAVPSTLVKAHPERDRLHVFALPVPQARFTVMQHWHGRVQEDPANQWLRQSVHDVVPASLKDRRKPGGQ